MFSLQAPFKPSGDQPQAIDALAAQLYSEFKAFFPDNAVAKFILEAEAKNEQQDEAEVVKDDR